MRFRADIKIPDSLTLGGLREATELLQGYGEADVLLSEMRIGLTLNSADATASAAPIPKIAIEVASDVLSTEAAVLSSKLVQRAISAGLEFAAWWQSICEELERIGFDVAEISRPEPVL